MTIEREEYRRTNTDVLYDDAIVATTSAPTLVTDGVEINDSDKKGPRYLSVGARITGGSAAAMRVWLYFWSAALTKWIQCSSLLFSTDAEVLADTTDTVGNSYQVVKPSWATRVFAHVPSGAAAANILNLVIEKDT